MDWPSPVLEIVFGGLRICMLATPRAAEAGQRAGAQPVEQALHNKVDDANRPLDQEMCRNRILESNPSGLDSLLLTSVRRPHWHARCAHELAAGVPFMRVDFCEVAGSRLFGEMTLYPGGGFEEFDPFEWDERLGSWIELPDGGHFR